MKGNIEREFKKSEEFQSIKNKSVSLKWALLISDGTASSLSPIPEIIMWTRNHLETFVKH